MRAYNRAIAFFVVFMTGLVGLELANEVATAIGRDPASTVAAMEAAARALASAMAEVAAPFLLLLMVFAVVAMFRLAGSMAKDAAAPDATAEDRLGRHREAYAEGDLTLLELEEELEEELMDEAGLDPDDGDGPRHEDIKP
jgi:hypothetical protein